MYVYILIYIHTYICVYTHTHTHTHIMRDETQKLEDLKRWVKQGKGIGKEMDEDKRRDHSDGIRDGTFQRPLSVTQPYRENIRLHGAGSWSLS